MRALLRVFRTLTDKRRRCSSVRIGSFHKLCSKLAKFIPGVKINTVNDMNEEYMRYLANPIERALNSVEMSDECVRIHRGALWHRSVEAFYRISNDAGGDNELTDSQYAESSMTVTVHDSQGDSLAAALD